MDDLDEEIAKAENEEPVEYCMECKRTPATISRGKARWCGTCLAWIERRKDFDFGNTGRRRKRSAE